VCAPSDQVHRRLQAGMSYGHHTSTSSKRSMHGEPHKSLSYHEVCITKKSRMVRLRDMRGFVLRWSANKQDRRAIVTVS
jgi:hypothetical protein